MPVYIPTNGIEAVELNITLLKGSDLVAKDRNMMGQRTTSDPYVVMKLQTTMPAVGRQKAKTSTAEIGKTKTIMKTVNPEWKDATFSATLPCPVLQTPDSPPKLVLEIYDYDKGTDDDSMGVVTIPLSNLTKNGTTTEWYSVPKSSAKNAKGKLQVQIQTEICKSQTLQRGNAFPLETNKVRIGLAWDLVKGKVVDLDAACVAIDSSGQISMDNSVYYGNLSNANASIVHSGDSRDGIKDGEDESMRFQLDKIPPRIMALYVILTVASAKRYLSSVSSARVTIVDESKSNQKPMASFAPSKHVDSEDATALFLVRIARSSKKAWTVQPIEDVHQTARDFGTLIPYLKSYTKDLLPDIAINPNEVVSVMRKGGAIKLKDFCPGKTVPNKLTFGLSWDMTRAANGKEAEKIDLDASAIMLDADLQCVDKVWFKKLQSEDGAIQHGGDQRSGDAGGDDERMMVDLSKIAARIQYIGFVVNSYSGQELDDVQKAACHLFDTATGVDIARHALSDCHFLDGHTALVMGCLYRVKGRSKKESEWCLKIISQAAMGKTVKDNVDELQKFLEDNPVHTPMNMGGVPEEGEITVEAEMPPAVPLSS